MALVCPDVAERIWLRYLTNSQTPTNPVVHLYTNNYDPTENTTLANLTEVSGISGYTAITLTNTGWTVGTTLNVTTASYPTVQFNMTQAVTVYGYFITNTGGDLLVVEKFDNAFILPTGGGVIELTPTVSLD